MSLDVTGLLRRATAGDRAALDELVPAVYDELHGLAARQLSHERAGHTLQPTALVNEAFIRMFGESVPHMRDRQHFVGIAVRIMRQVLIDYARRRASKKRSGGTIMVAFEERHAVQDPGTDLLRVEEALGRLGAEDPALVRLIELRFFGGLSAPEIAELAGESVHTIRRHLRYAQARLRQDLIQANVSSKNT
jgi:RNA polymerase sigma factor (TIGR02999 family)